MTFLDGAREREERAARERARREAWALRASVWLLLLGVGASFAGRSFRERSEAGAARCLRKGDGSSAASERCESLRREGVASADRLGALGAIVLVCGAAFVVVTFRGARAARRHAERFRDDEP